MTVYIVIEDRLSEIIMRKLLEEFLPLNELDIITIGLRGNGYIKNRINTFNNQKNDLPFFILADLDLGSCAPELLNQWLKRPCRKNLLFRIAVREVEAWLLADTDGFSKYLKIDHSFILKETNHPDDLIDPKSKLLSLVEHSRNRELIRDMIKKEGANLKQGPGYNAKLTEYVSDYWNIERASHRSESFNRAIKAIQKMSADLVQ